MMWMITGCSQGASSSSCQHVNYKPVARLLSVSHKSRMRVLTEACVQLPDRTGASTVTGKFLWSECRSAWLSWQPLLRLSHGLTVAARDRAAAPCGPAGSSEHGRLPRATISIRPRLKFKHTNGATNDSNGRWRGLVFIINSWKVCWETLYFSKAAVSHQCCHW